MPQTIPSYPPEFRRKANRLLRASDEDHPIPGIAREIGVCDGTLRNWVNQDEINSGERDGPTKQRRRKVHEIHSRSRESYGSPRIIGSPDSRH